MWDVEALHGILTTKFNVYLASNVFLIYFNFIHSEGKKGEAYTCKYTHSHIKTYSSNAHRVFDWAKQKPTVRNSHMCGRDPDV